MVYSLVGPSNIVRADMADRTPVVCTLHVTSEAVGARGGVSQWERPR